MNTKNTKKISSKKSSANIVLAGLQTAMASTNPWKETKSNVGKITTFDTFVDNVNLCRFFYKTEPVVSTVINKLVEISINDLVISKSGLSENEFRVFKSLKPRLLEFAEAMAQEFLLSGLVVPEIGYGPIDKDTLFELGIKKYNRLIFPVSMWVRDPKTIKINSSLMSDTPSYYITIPDEVIYFIKNKGKYPDGREDIDLFNELKTYYSDFVKQVLSGETELLLNNKLVLRRKYMSDEPYPIPYIAPVLDALQHKRELRRMDYSIIDKVIGAIMHIKVGSDEFPMTDTEEDAQIIADLQKQLMYRFNQNQNLERIFQLITNHTVDINWVFPDSALLANTDKYNDINQEILFGLGFPRVLITGEAQKTGTSDPEIALISPIKTMESMRRNIIKVIKDICKTVALENNFKAPSIKFKSLNLHAFRDFVDAMYKLYQVSGTSRTSMAEVLGYDFEEELDRLVAENEELQTSGLPEFGPTPNSRSPQNQQSPQNSPQNIQNPPKNVQKGS